MNIYGASKLAGEVELRSNSSKYLLLRTSWVFSEFGNNFVKKISQAARSSKELSVVNDQIGCPTYAGDLADAVIAILHRYEINKDLSFGVYHFAGQPAVSWFEFAEHILDSASRLGLVSKNVNVAPC